MNKDDYTDGQCHICSTVGEVRHKNIYHRGSEGLEICWNCEKALLEYIESQKRMFMRIKRDALRPKNNT